MSDYLMMGDLARWEVLWVKRTRGKPPRIICIEFENDFPGAMELYVKAKTAKKPLATLRCCNVGFPPPERFRPYYEERVTRVEKVRRKGKLYKKVTRDTVEVVPMEKLNVEKGVWWCPYCREMRKFQHYDGFMTGGKGGWFNVLGLSKPTWIPSPGMYCPLCGINQNDSHVRRWNPQAVLLEFRYKQQRSKRSGRRRRTRR